MSETGISIGEEAPVFSLPGTDGARHDLDAVAPAAATVVYWTCNHCPYALAWEGRVHDASRDFADRGVRFLAINSNDAERYPADSFAAMVERVERDGGWPHPYLHDADQEVARAFGARTTPHVFVFDAELALRYHGAPDSDFEDPSQGAAWLRQAVEAVLAGRAPEPAQSEPVGCGVKWK